jgi:hypothetical protein
MNEEALMIYNIFKTLDIEDAIKDFNKFAPYNLNNCNDHLEYAPSNLYLEHPCEDGNNCFYKKDPVICCKNHQTNNNIILKGQQIPNYLCRYERPWKKINGYQMRCHNIYCWFSHLLGRQQIINYISNRSNRT